MAFEGLRKALAGFRGSTRVAPTATAGTSAEEDFYGGGYIVGREKSPKLKGRAKYGTYSELVTNTLIVAASVRYFLNLIAGTVWTVQPPVDEEGEPLPGAEEVADFIEELMGDMETSWSRVIRKAAMFRFNGYSIAEWTAKKREDGRIGFLDVETRPCSTIERWDLDEGNTVLGVTQFISGRPETYLPRNKLVYIVDDALESTPEGVGLYRHLIRSAERLRGYEELEELAFETDLRGIPIGRAPLKELREANAKGEGNPGFLSISQVRKARAAVDNFVKNKLLNKSKGAVLDSETYEGTTVDGNKSPGTTRKWDVELLKGEGGPHEAAASAISRINREMAVLMGTDHLLLGSDGTGSLALGWTKLSSFFLVVTSTLGEIAEAFDRDYVQVACRLNGIPKELWPKLEPQDIDINDVEAVAKVLSELATAGAVLQPDDPAIDKVRARVGLPPAPEPPELDENELALIDRVRAAGVDPNKVPERPPEPEPKPGAKPEEEDVERGAQQAAETGAKKVMKRLGLSGGRRRRS